jgi:hypothetical protein
MTKKEKSNLRLKKICTRLAMRVSYKHLTDFQKKFIKLSKAVEPLERALYGHYGFYKTCKRTTTGAVDWDVMSIDQLTYFDGIYKSHIKAVKRLNNFIDKHNLTEQQQLEIFRMFNQTNCNSVCF